MESAAAGQLTRSHSDTDPSTRHKNHSSSDILSSEMKQATFQAKWKATILSCYLFTHANVPPALDWASTREMSSNDEGLVKYGLDLV